MKGMPSSGAESRRRGVWIFLILLTGFGISCSRKETGAQNLSAYDRWSAVGELTAARSLALMKNADASPQEGNLVVLTNAGYAEIDGESTQGALDGAAAATGATRGRNTLAEIHSGPWAPLWFAVYDRSSGYCAYTEINPSEAAEMVRRQEPPSPGIVSKAELERIDADYIQRHAAEFSSKFGVEIFGGNEFRIITIANAIAAGAPPYVVRALEFHDHYCPGVTSGILTALYVKNHFPPGENGYFVHSLEPWCKEDALLVLLNATPGKKSYAVYYPSDADKSRRAPEAKDASTIIYRRSERTKEWEGLILAFEWAEVPCPKTDDGIIDKLCADLWYLQRLEQYDDFVTVLERFQLPGGLSPEDWARPGIDPLKQLGLAR